MNLTILSVAYPLSPVVPDAVGGAEQILGYLDAALVRAGHRSLVLACAGSRVSGTLVEIPEPQRRLDHAAIATAHEHVRAALATTLARYPVDLVHLHGVDFPAYLPPPGVPTLATLHLPPDWYPREIFGGRAERLWLNCVSPSQHAACPASRWLLPPIRNGVPFGRSAAHAKRKFVLSLARICPEKGIHLALDAARRANVPALIAGRVFPYPEHEQYFAAEIEPRLDRQRRYIGAIGGARKRRLLAGARCVLIPSLVAETSSLVAAEAQAAGTPVIALRRGALVDAIEHGVTGFLVEDASEMADAIARVDQIDPEACGAFASRQFSLEQMVRSYFATYESLAKLRPAPGCLASAA
jgi:glycosyltransferase involved in cell wall biosynthesis